MSGIYMHYKSLIRVMLCNTGSASNTLPQDGLYGLWPIILCSIWQKAVVVSGLVKNESVAIWDYLKQLFPERSDSQFMCFICSWKVGLEALNITAWLSQNSKVGEEMGIWKSWIAAATRTWRWWMAGCHGPVFSFIQGTRDSVLLLGFQGYQGVS